MVAKSTKTKQEKPIVIQNDLLPENSKNGTIEMPTSFDNQFSDKFDWRYLKNREEVLQFIFPVVETEIGGLPVFNILNTGIVYNAHFSFTILEVGMSFTGTPTGGFALTLEKLEPTQLPLGGSIIPFLFKPKDLGISPGIGQTNVLPVTSVVANNLPSPDTVNIYEPTSDSDSWNFQRCDRLNVIPVGNVSDLGTVESICLTVRIKINKV